MQLLAEKRKGLDRSTSMQSSGNLISSDNLVDSVSSRTRDIGFYPVTNPKQLPGCVRYGKTTSRTLSLVAISISSSSEAMTNSKRQSRSSGRPNRPHTAGRFGLHKKRKSIGKKRSYTSSGENPSCQSGYEGCVSFVGRCSFQFSATHVSWYFVLPFSISSTFHSACRDSYCSAQSIRIPFGSRYIFRVNPVLPSAAAKNLARSFLSLPVESLYVT